MHRLFSSCKTQDVKTPRSSYVHLLNMYALQGSWRKDEEEGQNEEVASASDTLTILSASITGISQETKTYPITFSSQFNLGCK